MGLPAHSSADSVPTDGDLLSRRTAPEKAASRFLHQKKRGSDLGDVRETGRSRLKTSVFPQTSHGLQCGKDLRGKRAVQVDGGGVSGDVRARNGGCAARWGVKKREGAQQTPAGTLH
ncbi:hypothetical protein SKAU_G00304270 [Synaphobranchus kaupii]|uniref:Uncharacterized protein n=1 Tax=Synaphobranchus kaupii TaxID=118154 RepID=A0A9Q1EWC7_SYNKA|nr:hypothetical protein SKAU_G00304270 [Synaphobranchus kaupii]